jgi:hypothetical protein
MSEDEKNDLMIEVRCMEDDEVTEELESMWDEFQVANAAGKAGDLSEAYSFRIGAVLGEMSARGLDMKPILGRRGPRAGGVACQA